MFTVLKSFVKNTLETAVELAKLVIEKVSKAKENLDQAIVDGDIVEVARNAFIIASSILMLNPIMIGAMVFDLVAFGFGVLIADIIFLTVWSAMMSFIITVIAVLENKLAFA